MAIAGALQHVPSLTVLEYVVGGGASGVVVVWVWRKVARGGAGMVVGWIVNL